MDAHRRHRHRQRLGRSGGQRRRSNLHASKAVRTTRINSAEAEDYMGNALCCGQVGFSDQRILGLSRAISAVPGPSNSNNDAGSCGTGGLEMAGEVDERKLADASNVAGGVEYLDLRRLRAVSEFIEGSTKRQAIRRYGLGILGLWAATATIYAVMAYQTIGQLSETIRDIQATVNAAAAKQSEVVR